MSAVPDYDEFGFLEEYARREGLAWQGAPLVHRRSIETGSKRRVSMLVWGDAAPEVVLLHGRGQNAHTWDSVALALRRPLVAIDLPGHGHSDWRDDHDYGSARIADDLAYVIESFNRTIPVVGMSMGGLSALRIAATRPQLISKLMLVDITPGARERERPLSKKQRGQAALLNGDMEFASFDDMLLAVSATTPEREPQSLVAGVRHNAVQRPDGQWAWRYDPLRKIVDLDQRVKVNTWNDVDEIKTPFTLVRGAQSQFVTDADVVELQRRASHVNVHVVEGAGHSVQSSKPVVLAELIRQMLDAQ
jgi:pimeloyl-ACP methyl ester carboxylesterase